MEWKTHEQSLQDIGGAGGYSQRRPSDGRYFRAQRTLHPSSALGAQPSPWPSPPSSTPWQITVIMRGQSQPVRESVHNYDLRGGARASWRVATVVLAQHTRNPVDHLGPVTVFRVSNSFAARCRLVDCAGIWRLLEYRGAAAWAPPWSLAIICLTRNGNTPSWRAMSVSVSSRRQCPSTPSVWSASSRCPNCSLSW